MSWERARTEQEETADLDGVNELTGTSSPSRGKLGPEVSRARLDDRLITYTHYTLYVKPNFSRGPAIETSSIEGKSPCSFPLPVLPSFLDWIYESNALKLRRTASVLPTSSMRPEEAEAEGRIGGPSSFNSGSNCFAAISMSELKCFGTNCAQS